jgi:hypothetical protein
MSVAGQLFFAAALFAASVLCLCFPRKIQTFALSTAQSETMKKFCQSDGYALMGESYRNWALVMALLMVWVTFRGGY